MEKIGYYDRSEFKIIEEDNEMKPVLIKCKRESTDFIPLDGDKFTHSVTIDDKIVASFINITYTQIFYDVLEGTGYQNIKIREIDYD